MARRHVIGALWLCLAVGAGCQGMTQSPEAVTPAAVPSANGTATTNVNELVDRHRQELQNRSHTTTVTLTVGYPNGTTARRTDTFAIGSGNRFRYERRTVGPYPERLDNITVWQNGSREVRRENGTVTVQTSAGVDDTSLSQYLRRILGVFELQAESTATGYRLTGSAERAQSIPLPAVLLDHRSATAELAVRDGVLRTVVVDLRADRYDSASTVDVEIAVAVTAVGETTPTRPAWAPDAAATGS